MPASIEGFNDEAIKKRIEALALTCPKSRRFLNSKAVRALCAEINLTPAPPVKAELKPTLGDNLRLSARFFKFEATPPLSYFTDSWCSRDAN